MLRKVLDMLFYWKLLMAFVIFFYTVAILIYEPENVGMGSMTLSGLPSLLFAARQHCSSVLPRKTTPMTR